MWWSVINRGSLIFLTRRHLRDDTKAAGIKDLAGEKMAAGPGGQPFCMELGDLREFLTAAMTDDAVWIKTLMKEDKCAMLK